MSTSSILNLLTRRGPLASSEIKKYLIQLGASETSARQQISRASRDRIKKFTSIQLPKREAFLYLEEQYGSQQFWENLYQAHIKSNTVYANAISSIISRRGWIPKSHFKIISGAPVVLKGHISSDKIMEQLIRSKILIEETDLSYGPILKLTPSLFEDYKDININLKIIEDILVDAMVNWVKKTGFGSYDAIKKRTLHEIPEFGQFGWDITAPSYLHPFRDYTSGKLNPGFLVVDVANATIDKNAAKYFIKKCDSIRSIKKMRPFLSILMANKFSNDAFSLGKTSGLVFTTPEIMFGNEVAKSLQSLANTLENASAVAASNPDQLYKLLKTLSKVEGAAINVRGALFELLVGHIVLKADGDTINIGVTVNNLDNRKAEIDVQRIKGDHEVAIYECKGYQPTKKISIEEIQKWFEKIVIIYKALKSDPFFVNRSITFEYWTSGTFSTEAEDFLTSKKENTRKYEINWKNGTQIISYARSKKLTSMVDTLKEHYANHPLSKV